MSHSSSNPVKAMTTINGLDELESYLGKEIGVSDWHVVTQEQINRFADATLDHQWIHVDAERCALESPFKSTIAHGFFTLSMAPYLMAQIFEVHKIGVWINYGLNNVRFSTPVPVNSKLRMRAKLTEMNRRDSGTRLNIQLTFEIEGVARPVCVADSLSLLRPNGK
jgi:acyl dehydratase